MTTRWIRAAAAAAGFALLTGCTVGPKYQRPAVSPPPAFRGVEGAGGPESLADLKWFDLFKDDELQKLVRTALEQNYDLQEATLRIAAAQANVGVVRADQYPQLGAGADLTTLRFSTGGSFPLPSGVSQNRSFGNLTLSLLSYEADIWGRLRRATEGARATLLATEENRRALVSILVNDVTSAYFNLLEQDMELEIARRTLATRQDSLKLIRQREQKGLASRLELRQGEQLVYTAAEAIPAIERGIEQTENRIRLLLGQHPDAVPRGRALTDQRQPVDVPAGLPSALLARRPDIRAAEQSLVAANAQVGVARAAYFPRISLTGFLGTQSSQLTDLFSGPTNVWQAVPQLAQPLFTGGRIRNNERLARAQEQIAVVNYRRTIETAFREVADALVAQRKAKEIRQQQEQLVATLRDRSRLSYLRYRGGVDTLLNALDADRDLFGAELSLAQTRRDELLALVQLYRALGGGWQA
jgi:multidrug efflux system outer membrane protein